MEVWLILAGIGVILVGAIFNWRWAAELDRREKILELRELALSIIKQWEAKQCDLGSTGRTDGSGTSPTTMP